jgi:hypothetical protein
LTQPSVCKIDHALEGSIPEALCRACHPELVGWTPGTAPRPHQPAKSPQNNARDVLQRRTHKLRLEVARYERKMGSALASIKTRVLAEKQLDNARKRLAEAEQQLEAAP